jgi:hypothetical protein
MRAGDKTQKSLKEKCNKKSSSQLRAQKNLWKMHGIQK